MDSETTEVKQKFRPQTWVKGQSGNPAGRPKGSVSIKDKVRQYLEANPEEVGKIVEHFVKENRELMWQMLEDLTLGQNPELPFIINIQKNEPPGTDG